VRKAYNCLRNSCYVGPLYSYTGPYGPLEAVRDLGRESIWPLQPSHEAGTSSHEPRRVAPGHQAKPAAGEGWTPRG
jgi:hypothetical protein